MVSGYSIDVPQFCTMLCKISQISREEWNVLPADARMLFPGSQYIAPGETSPKAVDTKLFSSHINSPVPANVMIPVKKLEGFLKEIFSIGFELRLVCIRNYFKVLTEPKGFMFFKRELHKSRFCLLPCWFSSSSSCLCNTCVLQFIKRRKIAFSFSCTDQQGSALHLPWPPGKKKDFWHPIRNTQSWDVPSGSCSSVQGRLSFVAFLAHTRSLLAGSAVFSNCSLLTWN